MKLITTLFTFSLLLFTSSASVPLKWTVETSRLQPVQFDAVRGETLDLEASFQNSGKPLAMDGKDACIFWQTNGMGNAWWTAAAVATSNRIAATFTPAMDPGAAVVSGFLGATGDIYRAAFQLRFRHGPGASPNAITLPPPVLDLSRTIVVNPPWPTDETIDSLIRGTVDKAYVESLGITGGEGGVTSVNGQTGDVIVQTMTNVHVRDIVTATNDLGFTAWNVITNGQYIVSVYWNEYDSSWWMHYDDGGNGASFPTGETDPDATYCTRDGYEFRRIRGDGKNSLGLARLSDLPNTNDIAHIADEKVDDHNANENAHQDIRANVDSALAYASGTYRFMNASTNAWFEGTNYPDTVSASIKHKFAFEDGMDLVSMPCSMALREIRDGENRVVWDQRDWPTWYWTFKAVQLSNTLASATQSLSDDVRTNYMKRGWAKYTAVQGLDNPDPSSLWVDTPKVQLFAGHQWEKLVEVGGSGYWTLTGNGIELSSDCSTNTFLTIKDFEGNACLTFRKTASYLIYCECGTDIVSNYMDSQNRVTFHLTTDVQPTAEFSTTLELDSFVEQGEDGCPANYEWTGSAGSWDCHFLLKPGISSPSCFARFKVMHEGENVVEHTVPIKLSGGIVFEQGGVEYKIRPVVSGTTVSWSLVQ